MYVGMIETRSLKILLKSLHENYSDLLKKITQSEVVLSDDIIGNFIIDNVKLMIKRNSTVRNLSDK